MKQYKFLTEEKNTHIEHVEDLHLHGSVGMNHALSALNAVHRGLTGEKNDTKVSVKYDGRPAVVFGHHPESGKFFVGTKSVFNAIPKINHTEADIERNHASEGLKTKLKQALEHLPKITPPKGVFQGDIMHSGASDRLEHGHQYHFTPNTITYKLGKYSEQGKKMADSKLGIVPHTEYHGDKLKDMKAGPIEDFSKFKHSKDVHVIDPAVNLTKVHYDRSQQESVAHHLAKAREKWQEVAPEIQTLPTEHIRNYIHSTVRTGEVPSIEGFNKQLDTRLNNKKISKSQHALVKTHLEYNQKLYKNVIDIHKHIKHAKKVITRALDTDNTQFDHSISNAPAHAEGYVISHKGKMVKLVDREGFSRANFNRSR